MLLRSGCGGEVSELFAEQPGRLLEDVVDERFARRRRDRLLPGDRVANLDLDRIGELLALAFAEPAAREQIRLEAADRIALAAPDVGHLFIAIARRIVRRAVRAHAIREQL